MSEPSAFYCRVRLTQSAYEAFLRSPLVAPSQYKDWGPWLVDAEMYDPEGFIDSIPFLKPRPDASVHSLIRSWVGSEGAFARSEYSATEQTWRFGVVEFGEDYDLLVREFAGLRVIATYKDLPGVDGALVYPYLFGEDGLSAAMLIEQGRSRLVRDVESTGLVEEAKQFWKSTLSLARAATPV